MKSHSYAKFLFAVNISNGAFAGLMQIMCLSVLHFIDKYLGACLYVCVFTYSMCLLAAISIPSLISLKLPAS